MDAAAAITQAGFSVLQETALEKQISIFPARSFYPSSLGHPCERFVVWKFLKWQQQTKHGTVLQSIFNEGRHHQPSIYQALETIGFELVRESDRPRQYKVGGAIISGRPDGKITAFRGEKYRPALILEAKSMSGYQWDQVETIEDLKQAKSHWTRSYYAQGQLYCFLEDVPFGVFVLKSKQTGMLKCLPYELDFAYAEGLLKRVERLQPMIEQGVDPDPIPYDAGVCGGCGFLGLCYPARDFGAGASMLDDPALIEELEAIEQLKPSSQEYERRWKALRARFKREGVTSAIAGPFHIEASERPVGEVRIPPRVDTIYDVRRVS